MSMKYKVICLHNSDYCKLKPSDTVCQYTIEVEAESKEEARMLFHSDMVRENYNHNANIMPMLWEVL